MKSILIIGASSFLGKATLNDLEGHKFDLDITTRSKTSSQNSIYLDLEMPDEVFATLNSLKRYDFILLIASKIGWNTTDDLFTTNVLSTGIICHFAKKWQSKIIFTSAAIVCGTETENITENSPVKIDNDYAKSKFYAEQIIYASGVENCILRIGGIFGLNGPNHLGINASITAALQGKPIINKLKNEVYRNYIYLHDLTKIIIKVINEDITGTHLIASKDVISIKQMLVCITKILSSQDSIINEKLVSGRDQIIKPSKIIDNTLTFEESIKDIAQRYH